MKRAAFDRDRTAGAAVLRRVDEPTAKEPSQSPQTQPANANKVVEGAPKAAEAHNPLISSQHAQPSAGTSISPHAKWTYHEERFFFEYLRMIKGMQIRDDCVTSIAAALRTKDIKQVGTYYDNIITTMKRHLNTNIKKESSLENLHYTMVVYWERVMLPATETKYNKSLKSKDSKGDTGKKASQQQQQYRSDAGNGGDGTAATAGQSTGKKRTKKHKTAASSHAPGNGTSITPTQSICIEEEDQNQAILPPPATATAPAAAGAVASSGPLPVRFIKVRLLAASSIYLSIMQKHQYTGSACMRLPAHTSLVDMLGQLENAWQRAMPSTVPSDLDTRTNPTGITNNAIITPNDDGMKRCGLYLQAGSEASPALQGIKWGGPHCNADLTIGDVVSLLPTPREDGELVTLYYSWDLTRSERGGNGGEALPLEDGQINNKNLAVAVPAPVVNNAPPVEPERELVAGGNNTRLPGIAPALPGEDAHSALRKAIKAALDQAARQKQIQLAEAAAAAAAEAAAKAAKDKEEEAAPEQPTTATAPMETEDKVNTTTEQVAPQSAVGTVGQKRQRSELEAAELEKTLNSSEDKKKKVDVVAREEKGGQQTTSAAAVQGAEESERPSQRARRVVPVGLRTLLTTQAATAAPAAAAAKAKAKKSPKKNAAATRKKKQEQQMQQQQQQQAASAGVGAGGMPLPAGMANYLQWPGTQTQSAQVLQGQHQMTGPYGVQYNMQQQPQFYATHQLPPPPQQQQQQQTPLATGQPPRPPQPLTTTGGPLGGAPTSSQPAFMQQQQGFNATGMNSLFGDTMFRSLFETPLSNHQQAQQAQQGQQQERNGGLPTHPTVGVFGGAFNTPGKEPRTSPTTAAAAVDDMDMDMDAGNNNTYEGTHGNGNTISRLPLDWACLSPPPNFKLPPDFGTGSGTVGGASLLGGTGGHSLLPSTSLLGFMDAHPKAQGAAATVMQKGVEALFQQITAPGAGGAGQGVDDNVLAAEAAAAGGGGGMIAPTDTSLHSIDSLLEKSNSNWLAPFATAQATDTGTGTAAAGKDGGDKKKKSAGVCGGQQEDVPPVCDRPFAALFGS